MPTPPYSRQRLMKATTLSPVDLKQIAHCRRDCNRLGFAYHLGFVRLFNRLPNQHPLEVEEELLGIMAMRLRIDPERIQDYATRQPTVSDHQNRIKEYLELKALGPKEAKALEEFVFEESCRLEQTAALPSRAEEFLQERKILLPGEQALQRLIGEQKKRAHEGIFDRIARSLSGKTKKTLETLLTVPSAGGGSTLLTKPSICSTRF